MLFNSCCYPCIWRVLYHSSGMVQWWGRGVFGSEGARAGSCEVGFLQTLGLSEAGLAGAFGCYKRWASPRLGVSRGGATNVGPLRGWVGWGIWVLQTLGLSEAGCFTGWCSTNVGSLRGWGLRISIKSSPADPPPTQN